MYYMNKFAIAFGALIFSSSCGDDGDDGGGGGGGSLQAICERGCATTATLQCPNDNASTCVSTCVDEANSMPEACRSVVLTIGECLSNRPASDWECDEFGEATPKDGVCVQEQLAALTCVLSNQPSNPAPGDPAPSSSTCPFENDGECDDPTGSDICPAGTDLADCSR